MWGFFVVLVFFPVTRFLRWQILQLFLPWISDVSSVFHSWLSRQLWLLHNQTTCSLNAIRVLVKLGGRWCQRTFLHCGRIIIYYLSLSSVTNWIFPMECVVLILLLEFSNDFPTNWVSLSSFSCTDCTTCTSASWKCPNLGPLSDFGTELAHKNIGLDLLVFLQLPLSSCASS